MRPHPRFILALALACALTLTGMAGGARRQANDPLSFYLYQQQIFTIVGQLTWCGDCIGVDYTTGSPWVVNPGTFWPYTDLAAAPEAISQGDAQGRLGCQWDTDDTYTYLSQGGVLAAGASVTVTNCRYSPNYWQGQNDIWILSSSPDLVVTETWAWDGGSVTATVRPAFSSTYRAWQYFDCLTSPEPVSGFVEIPGSNGGRAVPQRITVTVANPTSRKVGKTGGAVDFGHIPGVLRGPGCSSWHAP